jgi:hypothetical protein
MTDKSQNPVNPNLQDPKNNPESNSGAENEKANSDLVNTNLNSVEIDDGFSPTVIPTTIKQDFEKFEDTPRENLKEDLYTSPTEVMQRTSKMSSEIATDVAEDEEDKKLAMDSGLDSFLEQLNISRKQFFIFVSFFVMLFLLLVFSIYFLFKYFGSSEEQVKIIDVVQEERIVESGGGEAPGDGTGLVERIKSWIPFVGEADGGAEAEPGATDSDSNSNVNQSENAGNESGAESTGAGSAGGAGIPAAEIGKTSQALAETRAVTATRNLGQASVKEDKLSYYIGSYRKVRNFYNTDLYSYLSQVTDRGKGFEAYMIQFKGANEEAKIAYEDLRQEIAELKLRVEGLNESAKEIENSFFTSLDELNSESVPGALKAFQEISSKRDLAKSELSAREAVATRFATGLPRIETKITAIELNRDPFVKGVKVVDYDKVDLDLVIDQ